MDQTEQFRAFPMVFCFSRKAWHRRCRLRTRQPVGCFRSVTRPSSRSHTTAPYTNPRAIQHSQSARARPQPLQAALRFSPSWLPSRVQEEGCGEILVLSPECSTEKPEGGAARRFKPRLHRPGVFCSFAARSSGWLSGGHRPFTGRRRSRSLLLAGLGCTLPFLVFVFDLILFF